MNLFNTIYYTRMFLNTVFMLTHQTEAFAVFSSLKREIRYTVIDLRFLNKISGTVLESTFKQYGKKQFIFLHFIIEERIPEFSVRFGIYKCKEYYIDCMNVVSYDIFNACSKLNVLTHFNVMGDSEDIVKKCPIYGEYKYKNLSIDSDKFMSSFSNPTEKWWEYYWKLKVSVYNERKVQICNATIDFYFIQFRSRN